jgi:hypothetical protein
MSTQGLTPVLNPQEWHTRVLFHRGSRLPLVCKAGNGLERTVIMDNHDPDDISTSYETIAAGRSVCGGGFANTISAPIPNSIKMP